MESKIILKKGDCIKLLRELPAKSVNMIFADPPYNLSGKNHITCKNGRKVNCNKGSWDINEDIDKFNYDWIKECMRVLKDNGTIWISGTLHNHPSIGFLLAPLERYLCRALYILPFSLSRYSLNI